MRQRQRRKTLGKRISGVSRVRKAKAPNWKRLELLKRQDKKIERKRKWPEPCEKGNEAQNALERWGITG